MKNKTEYTVILVASTSHAIAIEKTLKNAGLECRLVPVPRSLSSDCGVSVRILKSDKNEVIEKLAGANALYESVHDMDESSN
jgi:hypothetical protein